MYFRGHHALPLRKRRFATTLQKENALIILNASAHVFLLLISLILVENLISMKLSIMRAFIAINFVCFVCDINFIFHLIEQHYSFIHS